VKIFQKSPNTGSSPQPVLKFAQIVVFQANYDESDQMRSTTIDRKRIYAKPCSYPNP